MISDSLNISGDSRTLTIFSHSSSRSMTDRWTSIHIIAIAAIDDM